MHRFSDKERDEQAKREEQKVSSKEVKSDNDAKSVEFGPKISEK